MVSQILGWRFTYKRQCPICKMVSETRFALCFRLLKHHLSFPKKSGDTIPTMCIPMGHVCEIWIRHSLPCLLPLGTLHTGTCMLSVAHISAVHIESCLCSLLSRLLFIVFTRSITHQAPETDNMEMINHLKVWHPYQSLISLIFLTPFWRSEAFCRLWEYDASIYM